LSITRKLEHARAGLRSNLLQQRELGVRLVAAHPGLTTAEVALALRWTLKEAAAVLADGKARRVLQQTGDKWTLRGRRS
jgi:hypothetical protein